MLAFVGTLFANIFGCFIIGFLFALTTDKIGNSTQLLKPFIITGFLGGLTTFSTLNLEVFEFFKNGKFIYGLLYLFISCLLGLLFTFTGYIFYTKI